MPEMPDVIAGEAVESSWGNQIRDRSVQRYTDSTERDTLVPIPNAGDLAWLQAEQLLTVWNGSLWLVVNEDTHRMGFGGGQHLSLPPGTETVDGGLILWPSNNTVDVTVPAGATGIIVTTKLSQVRCDVTNLNHEVRLEMAGSTVGSTRVRVAPADSVSDVLVGSGVRGVTPLDVVTLRTRAQRVGGTGEMATSAEKQNFIDWRFTDV